MSGFNYALDRQEYTLNNALFWGNCVGHYQKAKQATWGNRIVHIIIIALEYLPVVGQIASIFEMIIVRCCTRPVQPDPINPNGNGNAPNVPPIQVENLDPEKETDEESPTTPKEADKPLQIVVTRVQREGETTPTKTPQVQRSESDLTRQQSDLTGSTELNPGENQRKEGEPDASEKRKK